MGRIDQQRIFRTTSAGGGRLPAHYLAASPCVTPTMLQLVGRALDARDRRGLTPRQLLAENGHVSAAQLQALTRRTAPPTRRAPLAGWLALAGERDRDGPE